MDFIFHLCEVIPGFGAVLIGTIDDADLYRRVRSHTTCSARPVRLDAVGSVREPETVMKLPNYPVKDFPLRFAPSTVDTVLELSGCSVFAAFDGLAGVCYSAAPVAFSRQGNP